MLADYLSGEMNFPGFDVYLSVMGYQFRKRAGHSDFPVDVDAKRLAHFHSRRFGLVLLHDADDFLSLGAACWRIFSPAGDLNIKGHACAFRA